MTEATGFILMYYGIWAVIGMAAGLAVGGVIHFVGNIFIGG